MSNVDKVRVDTVRNGQVVVNRDHWWFCIDRLRFVNLCPLRHGKYEGACAHSLILVWTPGPDKEIELVP